MPASLQQTSSKWKVLVSQEVAGVLPSPLPAAHRISLAGKVAKLLGRLAPLARPTGGTVSAATQRRAAAVMSRLRTQLLSTPGGAAFADAVIDALAATDAAPPSAVVVDLMLCRAAVLARKLLEASNPAAAGAWFASASRGGQGNGPRTSGPADVGVDVGPGGAAAWQRAAAARLDALQAQLQRLPAERRVAVNGAAVRLPTSAEVPAPTSAAPTATKRRRGRPPVPRRGASSAAAVRAAVRKPTMLSTGRGSKLMPPASHEESAKVNRLVAVQPLAHAVSASQPAAAAARLPVAPRGNRQASEAVPAPRAALLNGSSSNIGTLALRTGQTVVQQVSCTSEQPTGSSATTSIGAAAPLRQHAGINTAVPLLGRCGGSEQPASSSVTGIPTRNSVDADAPVLSRGGDVSGAWRSATLLASKLAARSAAGKVATAGAVSQPQRSASDGGGMSQTRRRESDSGGAVTQPQRGDSAGSSGSQSRRKRQRKDTSDATPPLSCMSRPTLGTSNLHWQAPRGHGLQLPHWPLCPGPQVKGWPAPDGGAAFGTQAWPAADDSCGPGAQSWPLLSQSQSQSWPLPHGSGAPSSQGWPLPHGSGAPGTQSWPLLSQSLTLASPKPDGSGAHITRSWPVPDGNGAHGTQSWPLVSQSHRWPLPERSAGSCGTDPAAAGPADAQSLQNVLEAAQSLIKMGSATLAAVPCPTAADLAACAAASVAARGSSGDAVADGSGAAAQTVNEIASAALAAVPCNSAANLAACAAASDAAAGLVSSGDAAGAAPGPVCSSPADASTAAGHTASEPLAAAAPLWQPRSASVNAVVPFSSLHAVAGATAAGPAATAVVPAGLALHGSAATTTETAAAPLCAECASAPVNDATASASPPAAAAAPDTLGDGSAAGTTTVAPPVAALPGCQPSAAASVAAALSACKPRAVATPVAAPPPCKTSAAASCSPVAVLPASKPPPGATPVAAPSGCEPTVTATPVAARSTCSAMKDAAAAGRAIGACVSFDAAIEAQCTAKGASARTAKRTPLAPLPVMAANMDVTSRPRHPGTAQVGHLLG